MPDTIFYKLAQESTQPDSLKYWSDLLGLPVLILTGVSLIVQMYFSNKTRKEELKWKQVSKAKELVDEMFKDEYAKKALDIIDFMQPMYALENGEKVGAKTEDIKNALKLSYAEPIYNEIRTSFDRLFYHFALFEHHISNGLISFEDVAFQADYYIHRLNQGIPGVAKGAFIEY
jgi:hypothetical protein